MLLSWLIEVSARQSLTTPGLTQVPGFQFDTPLLQESLHCLSRRCVALRTVFLVATRVWIAWLQDQPPDSVPNLIAMDDFASDTDSDYTSYWRDWVSRIFFICLVQHTCTTPHTEVAMLSGAVTESNAVARWRSSLLRSLTTCAPAKASSQPAYKAPCTLDRPLATSTQERYNVSVPRASGRDLVYRDSTYWPLLQLSRKSATDLQPYHLHRAYAYAITV